MSPLTHYRFVDCFVVYILNQIRRWSGGSATAGYWSQTAMSYCEFDSYPPHRPPVFALRNWSNKRSGSVGLIRPLRYAKSRNAKL